MADELPGPRKQPTHTYSLQLTESLFEQAEAQAQMHGMTLASLFRRCIVLGLECTRVQELPDGDVLIRQDGHEHKIRFL